MFIVYSKPACPFCDQAKALLESASASFDVIHVDVGQQKTQGETYIARDEFMSQFPTQRTLPLILKGSEKIGGFTELRKYMATEHRAVA